MTRPTLKLGTHSNKAVAVGAILFHVDHFVTGRVLRFTYGADGSRAYDPSDEEHVKRSHKIWTNPAGRQYVPGHFFTMLSRVRHPPPLVGTPRLFRYITGYQGSGGPRTQI